MNLDGHQTVFYPFLSKSPQMLRNEGIRTAGRAKRLTTVSSTDLAKTEKCCFWLDKNINVSNGP